MNPDCNPQEQNARQAYLEALYALDGRHDPTHESHGVYTGLFPDRIAELLSADKETLLGLNITADDDDTPLFELLGNYIGPGLIANEDACAAVVAAFCRILASRLNLAVRRLDPPGTTRATAATQSVMAVSDWLLHEAVRADLKVPARIDASPACVEAV